MNDTYTQKVLQALQSLSQVGGGAVVLDRLCEAAVDLVDGCDHASLMVLVPHGGVQSYAASSAVATAVDDWEKTLGEGPCIDVLDDAEPNEHLSADLKISERWPRLAVAVLEHTTVRGAAGFRLRVNGRKVGALNLFSERAGALTSASMEQAAIFSALATFCLAAAQSELRATTMQDGLRSNRLIGTAVGLMMANHKLSDAEAFEVLSRHSQESNTKVGAVAAEVVQQHNADVVQLREAATGPHP